MIYLSIYLSIHPSICMYIYIYLFVCFFFPIDSLELTSPLFQEPSPRGGALGRGPKSQRAARPAAAELGLSAGGPHVARLKTNVCWVKNNYIIWLVVWNMFYFPIYWESSSQLTNIFRRGSDHQPFIGLSTSNGYDMVMITSN